MLQFLKRFAKSLPPFRRILRQRDEYAQAFAEVVRQRDELAARVSEFAQRLEQYARLLDETGRHASDLAGRLEAHAAASASVAPVCFEGDGMLLRERTTDFLGNPRFAAAYRAGADSWPEVKNLHIEWRVLVVLWAATHALGLEGDFVECGVNTGVFALASCNYIDFNRTGRNFWLFDTFAGIPEEQMLPSELGKKTTHNVWYKDCYEETRRRFAPYPRVRLVRGKVPDSLGTVEIDKVCYLSIDMNIAYPERKALEHFWPKLSPGAAVVLDDYGFAGHEEQRKSADEFARSVDVPVLLMASGQGLILKPW